MQKVSSYTIEASPVNVREAKRLGCTTEPVKAWLAVGSVVLREFDGVKPHPLTNSRLDADQVELLRWRGRSVEVSVFDMG